MRSFTTLLLPCMFLSGCEVLDTSRLIPFAETKPASEVVTPEVDTTPELSRIVESFTGKISWYSVKTNGGTRTASGERFSDSENSRVLDVSIGAARKLDFVGKGVTNCRIDVLRKP